MREGDWHDIVNNAVHYLAIRSNDIYLSKFENDDFPWEFVTEVEKGALYRGNMCINIGFIANHPCGLKFRWSIDIEPEVQGDGGMYMVDIPLMKEIKSKISAEAFPSFLTRLDELRTNILENAESYDKLAAKYYLMAVEVRSLASSMSR